MVGTDAGVSMRIVIIGAGNVGFTSAEALSKVNDVLIVEKDAMRAENTKALLSVSVLHEDGSNPKVLEAAIKRIDADIIISAVPDDSHNLFICMMAKRIKPSIKTVACLRDPDYIIKTSKEGAEGVNLMISPELITAEKIEKLAVLENAIEYDHISSMDIDLATFRIEEGHSLVGKIVLDIDIPADCNIIAVYRGDSVILGNETAEIHAGDRIRVLGSPESIVAFNKLIGVEKEAKEFVILGASIVGVETAKRLIQGNKRRIVKIIDDDIVLSRNAARELVDVTVVNGDFIDPSVLRSENVRRADVVITVSSMDERNLLGCMAGLKFGIRKIISKYSNQEYKEIFGYTGIESIIGYHRVIFNEITKNLLFDENAVLAVENDNEFFFRAAIDERSALRGNRLGDISVPERIRVAAIRRGDATIYPRMDTMFEEGDKVLLFTHKVNPIELSRLLGHNAPLEL
ncbi:MAG: NAD-binding protein [Candidatus Methanoplasma sp.]|jgi:trk system potassium uptake protein TrkA|nr:NAD-binding protein [Candidatus Methanoplasma sp.]